MDPKLFDMAQYEIRLFEPISKMEHEVDTLLAKRDAHVRIRRGAWQDLGMVVKLLVRPLDFIHTTSCHFLDTSPHVVLIAPLLFFVQDGLR